MSQLEPLTSEPEESTDVLESVLTLEGVTGSIEVPDDATATEAAVIAAAVGAHVTDRQQAAAAALEATSTPDRTDQWVLADRMRTRGKRHWPRDVERGDEWQAAARSF